MPSDCRAGIVPDTAKEPDATKFFDFAFEYHRIRSLTDVRDGATEADTVIKQMCACLYEGFPIIFGFTMYYEEDGETEEFFNNKNWDGDIFKVNNLENRTNNPSGGHAVLCVGYDSENKLFRIMNSYGDKWKGKGFFWLPFSWFEQRSRTSYDLWTIRPSLAPLLRDIGP